MKFKIPCLLLLITILISLASSTGIESGYFEADSTGVKSIDLEEIDGEPDYVEFVSYGRVQGLPSQDISPDGSNDCSGEFDDGWGVSRGVTTIEEGLITNQQSVNVGGSTNNIANHDVRGSKEHVINQPISLDDGEVCGYVRISMDSVSESGFQVIVEDNYYSNQVVGYRAFNLPENSDVETGFIEVSSTGAEEIQTSHEPDYLWFTSNQQIHSLDEDINFRSTSGTQEGFVDMSGETIEQYSIGTQHSSDSINEHRVWSSDENAQEIVYQDDDNNIWGRTSFTVEESLEDGFEININEVWDGSDNDGSSVSDGSEYVQFASLSLPEDSVNLDYNTITNSDTYEFGADFEPQSAQLLTHQHVDGINVENPQSSGSCSEHPYGNNHGWIDSDSEFSIAWGTQSDSIDYSVMSADDRILDQYYIDDSGNICGSLIGNGYLTENSLDLEVTNSDYDDLAIVNMFGPLYSGPPEINQASLIPEDGAEAISPHPDLEVQAESPDDRDLEYKFYDSNDNLVYQETDVTSGDTVISEFNDHGIGGETGEKYDWSVEIDDGIETVESDLFEFTTLHHPDTPEILSPEGGDVEIDSDFEVEVSHPDGEEMFVELVLTEDDSSFVDDFTGDFNDGVVTNFDPDLSFDTDYELEATASVSDDNGDTFSASESVDFGTELAPEDLAEIKTNNTDPEDAELEFELDGSVDQIQLVDNDGDIKGFDSDPGTSSLIEVSESLDPDREYEWTAEIFKDGDLDREIDFSFTTAVVNVDVSEVENAVVYRLFRADEEQGDYEMVDENSLESGIISDAGEGLLEGETYCYRVQGVSVQGIESNLSEPECLESGVEVSSP